MDADGMKRYVVETFDGVGWAENDGDTFFYYDPTGEGPPERWIPFATIVTGDRYDTVSALDEPGRYRVNVGLTRATYEELSPEPGDYTATDVLLPHPEYASQHWVCVVNPGEATLDTVRILLAEAYALAVRRYDNRRARRDRG
jgi:Family of unknown function (DUF6194)